MNFIFEGSDRDYYLADPEKASEILRKNNEESEEEDVLKKEENLIIRYMKSGSLESRRELSKMYQEDKSLTKEDVRHIVKY